MNKTNLKEVVGDTDMRMTTLERSRMEENISKSLKCIQEGSLQVKLKGNKRA